MSNESNSKRRVSLSLALVALVLGVTAGAGAVLWWWKGGAPAAPMEAAQAAAPGGGPCNGKPAKLYRNPMGAPDTSPVPKKDSMGMDYIPVCEDTEEAQDGTIVKVSLDRVQRLGVRGEVVEERALARTVRAFASVQYDERRPEAVRRLQPRTQRAAAGVRPVAQHAGAGRRR
jgi:membrane fusion protein, copper/silver efflux system